MRLISLIFACSFSFMLFSQGYTINNIPVSPSNVANYEPTLTSLGCMTELDLGKGIFQYDNDSLCVGGAAKFYHELSATDSMQLGIDANFAFQVFTNINLSTPLTSSFRLFGPFNDYDDYRFLIENNMVSAIENGSSTSGIHPLESLLAGGKIYVLEITASACSGFVNVEYSNPNCFKVPCENCIPKFQPVDDRYVVSAWVKELQASTSGALNYTKSHLKVSSGTQTETFQPSGQIIDGWQRIEGIIQTNSVGNLRMELIVDEGIAYFDDIRVFPFDGSMVTYVYDPVTLRLMAEMDERNYAKIYEYDEEGKLVRVKKETEKGIMTIQENRENSSTND